MFKQYPCELCDREHSFAVRRKDNIYVCNKKYPIKEEE